MSELAHRSGSDFADLERLIRYAAGRRLIKIDRRGRVRPTGVTRALRSDATAPWRGWVRFAASDWFQASWRKLAPSIAKDSPGAFELAHGAPFFEFTTRVDPTAGDAFDQAMTAGATLQGIALARTLDWSNIASVCDVGGGRGAALDVIQRYYPWMNATLFDLPEVVAHSGFDNGAESPRRKAIGGSFFEDIPAGHDRYLMLAIIHDWDDAQAAAILTNVRDAMGGAGEAVVVENLASKHPRDDFATASDLLMFVLASGRERTRGEYSELFGVAGLRIEEERMLPTGATAFTLRDAAQASELSR